MASFGNAVFSPDGQYFAFYHSDGKLKIWDTIAGALKQEYTPNEHLTLPCSSLSWAQLQHLSMSPGSRKKKRRNEEEGASDSLLLLLGLTSGSVLVYSLASSKVEGELQGAGLSAAVRSLTWTHNNVYAGTSDGSILHWKVPTSKITSKWRSSKSPVSALVAHPSESWLLSGALTVSLWDVESKEELRSFAGHASPISRLLLSADGTHVISMARADRHINVWALSGETPKDKKRKAQQSVSASFVLPDQPLQVAVGCEAAGSPRMVVVTEGGALHCFSQHINGVRLPPAKPHLTVQIASSVDQAGSSAVDCIPIVGALVNSRDSNTVHIAHGSAVQLRFEKINVNVSKEVMWLVRQNSRRIESDAQQPSSSKVKGSQNSEKAHYVTAAGVKRPRDAGKQLPIEQRINNLSVSQGEAVAESSSSSKIAPSADSLAHLLAQGLQSRDQKLLRGILLTRESGVVTSTVARLAPSHVPALLQELAVLVHWRGWKGEAAARWLHALLVHHGSLVLASPALPQLLGPLLGLVDARLTQMAPLARLRGRLGLLLGQLAHGRANAAKGAASSAVAATVSDEELLAQTPLLHYRDGEESSSDELSAVEESDSEEPEAAMPEEESDSEPEELMVNGVEDEEDGPAENGEPGSSEEEEMETSS